MQARVCRAQLLAQSLVTDYQAGDIRIELYRATEYAAIDRKVWGLTVGQLYADGRPVRA